MSGEWLMLDLPEAREAAMRELGLWSRFCRRIGEQEKTAGEDDDGRAWLRKPRHMRNWAGMGNDPSFAGELSQIEGHADAELIHSWQRGEWEMWMAPPSDPLATRKVDPTLSLSGLSFYCDNPREIAIGPVKYWVQFRRPAPVERSDPPATSRPIPAAEGEWTRQTNQRPNLVLKRDVQTLFNDMISKAKPVPTTKALENWVKTHGIPVRRLRALRKGCPDKRLHKRGRRPANPE
jgi:hypothetical protein